jgi:Phage derived protein Gp49-like (DUF891)
MGEVVYLPPAVDERAELPARDRAAVDNAVAKLEAMGPALPYPHSSNVEGWNDLRELRPQAGKSPWRPLYRKVGDRFVIAAIGPRPRRIGVVSTRHVSSDRPARQAGRGRRRAENELRPERNKNSTTR